MSSCLYFQMESEGGEASYGVLKIQSPVLSAHGQGTVVKNICIRRHLYIFRRKSPSKEV